MSVLADGGMGKRGGSEVQRDVVYLGLPIAPSYMSQNAGGGREVAGPQPMSTAVHRSPNKLWRSNSIFNLWSPTTAKQRGRLYYCFSGGEVKWMFLNSADMTRQLRTYRSRIWACLVKGHGSWFSCEKKEAHFILHFTVYSHLTAYTVKKGLRHSRPQPGCLLPNSH